MTMNVKVVVVTKTDIREEVSALIIEEATITAHDLDQERVVVREGTINVKKKKQSSHQ